MSEYPTAVIDQALARLQGDPLFTFNRRDVATRVLSVTRLPRGVDGAAILAHEARHGDGEIHVACPDAPEDSCDDEGDGAYGLQRSVHALLLDRTTAEALAADQRGWIRMCDDRIVP